MALLSDARATAATRADELTAQISHLRDRLNGRVQRADDDPVKLHIELDQLLAEQKALQARRPIEMGIIETCKGWLAALRPVLCFEQVNPGVEDGLSLSTVRARIKKLKNQVEVLKGVPIPPSNVREKIQNYVQGLTRPVVGGIALDEALTVQWPTGLHVLMAFLQPEVLVERLMAEINRIANTPCALPEREQRIAELEQQIDRLQRTEEAIVVATGAPRERGCPPWVVLGVKATEAPGVRAA
jgi:Tfp pilus assembly protein PilN